MSTTTSRKRRASITFSPGYFIDSLTGNDSNDGLSPATPWRTLNRINQAQVNPGDHIRLARGSAWNELFIVAKSGVAGNPVIIEAYGSGLAPVLMNANGGSWAAAIEVYGQYIIIDGLMIRDTLVSGVRIDSLSSYITVRNCEITNVGFGIEINGDYNLVTGCYVHDLHMILNTPTNVNNNDDFGAVAFNINGTNNEIAHNSAVNCSAPSYDYGSDGGFVEVWTRGDDTYVHHNWAYKTNGFFELGAPNPTDHANNIRVAYNIIEDTTGVILNVNHNNSYSITATNLKLENNTIVMPTAEYQSIIYDGVTPADLLVRNNIFHLGGTKRVWWGNGSFTHNHNLYWLTDQFNTVGYTLDATEQVADPQFVNIGNRNYHLQSASPARGLAMYAGYGADLDGKPVVSPYDAGAYQFA